MADAELVKVQKEGVVLAVHPDALAQHKELGWELAPKDAVLTKLDEGPAPGEAESAEESAKKKK